jgi:RNA polymerase sigma-70 factor (ECF subfamily)
VTPADATCWTLIRDAARGDPAARERFARVYLPAVRAYLAARWRTGTREVDDAAQDVFVECFKANGVLAKADAERPGGFRAFLFGAVRNVALRREAGRRPAGRLPADLPADDPTLSRAFDRTWARSLLKEAARVQAEAAASAAARKRVELLRLRFSDGLPVKDIATRWAADSAWVHHEYATARDEFRQALRTVVAFHHPGGTEAEVDAACGELLAIVG